MRRYAFLDRDGTLVPEYPDEQWRGRTEIVLLPGVGEALRRLASAGYAAVVVVTNQYLIGDGPLPPTRPLSLGLGSTSPRTSPSETARPPALRFRRTTLPE